MIILNRKQSPTQRDKINEGLIWASNLLERKSFDKISFDIDKDTYDVFRSPGSKNGYRFELRKKTRHET